MLSQKAEAWFNSRELDIEAVHRMGIFSGKRVEGLDDKGEKVSSVVADPNGELIVFPYFDRGVCVGEKYRGRPRPDGSKTIWSKTGSKATFWNVDILDDPSLQNGTQPLVVVEGEPDLLAVLTCGWPFVVSTPGAPPWQDKDGNPLPPVPAHANDIDPKTDTGFAYVPGTWERTKGIAKIILFTDGDEGGSRLADELARRYGRARCYRVAFPDGCKDANEVLLKHGRETVLRLIAEAKPYPVRGLYQLKDMPEPAPLQVLSTGFSVLDIEREAEGCASLMMATGMFMVVLGKPSSGKSSWTQQLAAHMAELHGWRIALCSPEMPVVPFVRQSLRTHFLHKHSSEWTWQDKQWADDRINDHFSFILADSSAEDDEDPSIDWVLEKAHAAVIRHGINMLVIDPWNELAHAWPKGETETQYTERAIKKLKRFGRTYDVLVVVVIHPEKEGGKVKGEDMSLYHAAGSAHWYNKADIGVVFTLDEDIRNVSNVNVKKVRFRELGRRGKTPLPFDVRTQSFIA